MGRPPSLAQIPSFVSKPRLECENLQESTSPALEATLKQLKMLGTVLEERQRDATFQRLEEEEDLFGTAMGSPDCDFAPSDEEQEDEEDEEEGEDEEEELWCASDLSWEDQGVQ